MNIVIIGATSAIAQSVARRYVSSDVNFILLARNADKLDIVKNDLLSLGAMSAECYQIDFDDYSRKLEFIEYIKSKNIEIDLFFIAYGVWFDQTDCEQNLDKAIEQINSNYNSVVTMLLLISPVLIKARKGCIAVITSVAGDRGRKSNFIYGSAKAGLTVFLEGLRYKLFNYEVSVITLKPGFVDTPMTKDCKKGLLWVSSDAAAKYIVKAIEKNKSVAYIPPFWFWIMQIIRLIPEFIFRKLNF